MENVTNLVCHPKMQIWKDTPSLRISSPRQDFFYMAVSGDAIKYNKLSQKYPACKKVREIHGAKHT